MSMDAVQHFCNCSTTYSCSQRVRCDTGANYYPASWTSPLPSSECSQGQLFHAALWSSINSMVHHTALQISSGNWFGWEISKQNRELCQQRLHGEGDEEKPVKAQSQWIRTDPLVKTRLSMNSFLSLCLPSCSINRVWVGSMHLFSPLYRPARYCVLADRLHQQANSPLLLARPFSTLPRLGHSSMSQQNHSWGCSWFSATSVYGSQKGLAKVCLNEPDWGVKVLQCWGRGGGVARTPSLGSAGQESTMPVRVACFKSCCIWRLLVFQEFGVSVRSTFLLAGYGQENILRLVAVFSTENNKALKTTVSPALRISFQCCCHPLECLIFFDRFQRFCSLQMTPPSFPAVPLQSL